MKKELTFKQLEKIVNEEVVIYEGYGDWKKEADSVISRYIYDSVTSKITSVLKEYGYSSNDIRVTTYGSGIYLCHGYSYYSRHSNKPDGIRITVRKTKDNAKSDWRNTKYKFKKIEIEETSAYENNDSYILESVQDYIDYKERCKQRSINYKNEKANKFLTKVQDAGIDIKTLLELTKEYKDLDYEHKTKIAKAADPDHYYYYI